MDSRLYFIFGDLIANIVTGLVVGWLCWALFDFGDSMIVTMFVAMALGMLVGFALFFPFSILFGAMEVMVPLMFTGMVSGMIVGMWCTMTPLTGSAAAYHGGVCGLAAIVGIWIVNQRLRGPQRSPETS